MPDEQGNPTPDEFRESENRKHDEAKRRATEAKGAECDDQQTAEALRAQMSDHKWINDPEKARKVQDSALKASRTAAQYVKKIVGEIARADEEKVALSGDLAALEEQFGEFEAAVILGVADKDAPKKLEELRGKISTIENSAKHRQLRARKTALQGHLTKAVEAYFPLHRARLVTAHNSLALEVTDLQEQYAALGTVLRKQEDALRRTVAEHKQWRFGPNFRPARGPKEDDEVLKCANSAVREAEENE